MWRRNWVVLTVRKPTPANTRGRPSGKVFLKRVPSRDELENDLQNAHLEVIKDTGTIQKLTGFHWAVI